MINPFNARVKYGIHVVSPFHGALDENLKIALISLKSKS